MARHPVRWALALVALAAASCSDCSCDWEGGQTFSLVAASVDGNLFYADVEVKGAPCCEDRWTRTVTIRAALEGATGEVVAERVAAKQGAALLVDGDGQVVIASLGLTIRPIPGDEPISVMQTQVAAFEIVQTEGGGEVGFLVVPAGPAVFGGQTAEE